MGSVSEALSADTGGQGRVEVDRVDLSGQTLLVWYPRVDASDTGYVQAAVKIESGAKSTAGKRKGMCCTLKGIKAQRLKRVFNRAAQDLM